MRLSDKVLTYTRRVAMAGVAGTGVLFTVNTIDLVNTLTNETSVRAMEIAEAYQDRRCELPQNKSKDQCTILEKRFQHLQPEYDVLEADAIRGITNMAYCTGGFFLSAVGMGVPYIILKRREENQS